LGIELVTIDGEILRLGGKHLDAGDYDLMGVMTGSEGLLGIVSEVTLRILQKPATQRALLVGFDDTGSAAKAVGDVIGAGIIPAGMEMMDGLAINAAEDFANAGYPRGAAALLIIELDGPEVEVNTLIDRVAKIMDSAGASSLKVSNSEEERNLFWAGRKSAFPAVGRISPDYLCMDGTIPRRRLPDMMVRMASLSQKYGLRVANVFHAGDGNLHPLILFDANQPGELQRAEDFGADILRACVEMGGVLTGEHGVGVEKRDLMGIQFTEDDMKQQQRLKCAFDADHLLNPGKMFPHLHRCAELGRLHVHKGKMPFPDLPRF
jgi:glycolate oxidase